MFAQTIVAAKAEPKDYTHCSELEILIDNQPFPHLLYHFMLPYSRWEFVCICHTESFETLTKGYELAVAKLGAVAPEHRTDNLAAAVPVGEHGTFQVRWMEFLKHYGVIPSSNNPGCSNENGSVEKSNDLFKHAIDQRLRLRGDRNFRTVEDYESYLEQATLERNDSGLAVLRRS
ncbi:MAG: transposase family protein [Candidatus Obscuribacter sp.]|nr:transposase family protein [Candidatus Obscuribacter sp.]